MENVPGLLSPQNAALLSSATSIVKENYHVLKPLVLSASNFGLPTKRKRMFVIGFSRTIRQDINISHFRLKSSHVTVSDAISDLPSPSNAQQKDDFGCSFVPNATQSFSEYANSLKGPPPEGLGWSVSTDKLKRGFVSGFQPTIHSVAVASRYALLEGGQTDGKSKSKRLSWLGQSPTLRAGTGRDKGSFQAVRPIHPSVGRVITVREAARLQGFPDWFVFHPTKWHSFRMIGNSVPPLLARQLISKIFTII